MRCLSRCPPCITILLLMFGLQGEAFASPQATRSASGVIVTPSVELDSALGVAASVRGTLVSDPCGHPSGGAGPTARFGIGADGLSVSAGWAAILTFSCDPPLSSFPLAAIGFSLDGRRRFDDQGTGLRLGPALSASIYGVLFRAGATVPVPELNATEWYASGGIGF